MKGNILKDALAIPHKGPHRTAIIRSAISQEMERYAHPELLPPKIGSLEISDILAPSDRHLTTHDEERLQEFAEFLEVVDRNPSAHAPYGLLGDKFARDLGL
ncbi:hypothetical protein ACF8R6_03115 [Pseudomonas sp. CJQ_7]|uniref:hypothetical protein n=1 Tax=Pseudomonas sp. CJQ_7 TaxID=3367166 RepID=UPI00370B69D4